MPADPSTPVVPASSARRGWAAALLLQRPELLSRFRLTYERLRALPRGLRRRLQRRAAVSLAGAALLLALSSSPYLVPPAQAAAITADGVVCTLIDAIRSAEADASLGGCAAGSGDDTITLTSDVLLTDIYATNTGLPPINTTITIEGNGHTIARDTSDPDRFRILLVEDTGDLTLNDVTITGGSVPSGVLGGGIYNRRGDVTINGSTVSGNYAYKGGGIAGYGGATIEINDSVISGNYAISFGGGISAYLLTNVTVTGSIISDNTAADRAGGGISAEWYSYVTLSNSTVHNNTAHRGGGIYSGDHSPLSLTNVTVSGNEATSTVSTYYGGGGGLFIKGGYGTHNLTNVTITGNTAVSGGGVFVEHRHSINFVRSLVSGNTGTTAADEVFSFNIRNSTITSTDSVFGHDAQTNNDAFFYFIPGASDVNATSYGAGIPLAAILDTNLANNGGPTLTHDLVPGSPALDLGSDAACAATPVNGVDQRGFPRPLDLPGVGNDGSDFCDAGAVEYTPPPAEPAIFLSAKTAGKTADNVSFGSEDILLWNGGSWSKWFDGDADAGLNPVKTYHNIDAFWIPDPSGEEVFLSFTRNQRPVPGINGIVDGMDIVRWNGTAFSLLFDGQDAGLENLTAENVDALHVLPGSEWPGPPAACLHYLLVSTKGAGNVPAGGGGTLKFSGEDVLGFCLTQAGANTAGLWTMVLDGSTVGMNKNSTESISLSDDGQTLHLTTTAKFTVNGVLIGNQSMVFAYDLGSQTFSGPLFIAPAEGLPKVVDGLQVN